MKSIIIPVLLIFFTSQAFSQKQLTLNEAIQLAKKNNSDFLMAKLDKLKAERKVSEVYSENLVPTFTLSSQYIRTFKKQVINIFGQNYELGTDNSIITTLNVSESIPVLGTPVMNGIRIAEYYSELQDETVSQVESKIKADVTKSFYNVLLMKEVVELKREVTPVDARARITGRCSGRAPAITALAATISTVYSHSSWGGEGRIVPTISSAL